MQKIIQSKIKELEDYIGFPITRKELSLESKEPHDVGTQYTTTEVR